MARAAAEALIARYAIEAPEHVVLERIAKDLGARVVVGRLDGGLARLVRRGDRGVIRISDTISNAGRRRFSLGHELGHFVLRHAGGAPRGCSAKDLEDFGGSAYEEIQANIFATEFLLPRTLVEKRCDVSPVSLRPIRQIAEDFGTSITSAALRFVELSTEPCAIVFSIGGEVSWFRKNSSFYGYLPTRGARLNGWSLAGRYFSSGEEPADYAHWVDSDCWCEGRDGMLKEHSMPIPSIEGVLTLLWQAPEE